MIPCHNQANNISRVMDCPDKNRLFARSLINIVHKKGRWSWPYKILFISVKMLIN